MGRDWKDIIELYDELERIREIKALIEKCELLSGFQLDNNNKFVKKVKEDFLRTGVICDFAFKTLTNLSQENYYDEY